MDLWGEAVDLIPLVVQDIAREVVHIDREIVPGPQQDWNQDLDQDNAQGLVLENYTHREILQVIYFDLPAALAFPF